MYQANQLRTQDAADKTSALFEPLIEELMTVRQSSTNLTQEVTKFAEVAQKQTSQEESFASKAGQILGERIDELSAVFSTAHKQNRERHIDSLNGALRSCARELEMLSSLTLIVTSQVDQSEFDRESFIANIRGLSRRFLIAAKKIESSTTETRKNRLQIVDSLSAARSDLKVLTNVNIPSESIHLDVGPDIGNTVAEAESFKDGIAVNTRAMVACMQHPDALRQRAEHVDAMIEHASGLEAEDAAIFYLIASEQCADMSKELSVIVSNAETALTDMISSGRDVAERIRHGIAADDRTAQLGERRKILLEVIGIVADAHNQTSDALQGLEKMHDTLQESKSLFDVLRNERESVRISAFNASIAERRIGKRAVGMNVLTTAIRDIAEQCSSTIDKMTRLMTDISVDALAVDKTGLEKAFEQTQNAVNSDEEALSQLISDTDIITTAATSCESSIKFLLTAAELAVSRLNGMNASIAELKFLSERFANSTVLKPTEVKPDIKTSLVNFYQKYTMESERQVHQEVFNALGLDTLETDSNVEVVEELQEDLVDILF